VSKSSRNSLIWTDSRPAKAINSAHAVSSVNCHSSSPRNITIIIKQRLIYEDELTAERGCRPAASYLSNELVGWQKEDDCHNSDK
jgi:hypothetical protein